MAPRLAFTDADGDELCFARGPAGVGGLTYSVNGELVLTRVAGLRRDPPDADGAVRIRFLGVAVVEQDGCERSATVPPPFGEATANAIAALAT